MTFYEFLLANGESMLLEVRNAASPSALLPVALHEKLVALLRTYMLVGVKLYPPLTEVRKHHPCIQG